MYKETPEKYCEHCGQRLIRQRFPSGLLEGFNQISKRRFCGKRCAAKATRGGHGASAKMTGAYRSWLTMNARCRQPKREHFHLYGGRGIKICERWRDSFEAFLQDMGERPPRTSLDRINPNGDYEPGNCRWSTQTEQCRNKRTNLLVTHAGRTQCLAAWAEEMGIPYARLQARKQLLGWSDEDLFKPLQVHRRSAV